MTQGNLNVANNLTLASLAQAGGTLAGTGNVSINRFSQTGGAVANTGNFSVENAFTQSDSGIVAVGGNIAITQLVGDLNTTSLGGNNITLTANKGAASLGAVTARGVLTVSTLGNITQSSSSIVTSGSGSTLTSSNGDIVLPNIGNDQDGGILASANNITLTDASNPIFVLNTAGNSTLVSGGNLAVSGSSKNLSTTSRNGTTSFGATSISGDLVTNSSGSVRQTSAVTVTGSASITTNGLDLTSILSDKALAAAAAAKAAADAQALLDAAAGKPAIVVNSMSDSRTLELSVLAKATASLASILSGASASLSTTKTKDAPLLKASSSNEDSVASAEN
jgi:hypothetical protein